MNYLGRWLATYIIPILIATPFYYLNHGIGIFIAVVLTLLCLWSFSRQNRSRHGR